MAEQVVENVQKVDISLLISVIALILSVLSPALSAIISGRYHLKGKSRELAVDIMKINHKFYEQHRVEVIERYITAAGRASKSFDDKNREAFGAAVGEIYMYVNEDQWPLLDEIVKKLSGRSGIDATDDIVKLCKALSKENIRLKLKQLQE